MKQCDRRTMCVVLAGAGALMALAGCASDDTRRADLLSGEGIESAYREPAPYDAGDRPVSEALVLGTMSSSGDCAELIGRTKMEAAWAPAPGTGSLGGDVGALVRVQLSTNRASAEEVLRTLVGEYLGRSYVFDPGVVNESETVTLSVDEEMTPSDIRDLLGGLATVYGWMIEERGDVLYVKKMAQQGGRNGVGATMGSSPEAPILKARAAFESDQPAVRIMSLDYIAPTDATGAVEALLSAGGSVTAIGRHLLIVDTVRQTNRLSRVVEALDVPAFSGVEVHTYRLKHRTAVDAVQTLNSIAQSSGLTSEGSGSSFLAIPGTSDVMVIARDPSVLTVARDLIELVDRAPNDTSVGAYIYRIQNYDPSELVRLVREFFGDTIETSTGVNPALTGRTTGDGRQRMRLVLDPVEDLLLVRARADEYADLLALLRAIDRPRQQVMLNSIIAEVTLENRLEFGVDYFLNAANNGDGTTLDLFGTPNLASAATGTLSLIATDVQVVINALRAESDVDILSQPRLVVRDRANAEFQVGGSVPVITGDVSSDTVTDNSTAIRRDIEYRDTGVILTITPRINESGSVTLEIDQVINEVGNTTDLGPEFTTRTLRTEVTVPHGKTILLAGIIENTIRRSTRRIPVLGEIPVIGAAFSNTSDTEERRELLLAITPTIVSSPDQAQGTLGDFLNATEALRAAMHSNDERLPRAVLNVETLETPLGGYSAPESDDDGADETIDEETTTEPLNVPASHMRGISHWTGGAVGR